MKILLKSEDALKTLLGYWIFMQTDVASWIFFVCFFLPDLSILFYSINKKLGAYVYNIFHHQGLAIIIGIAGFYLHNLELQISGCILFSHSAFDRMLGFGLKYSDDFKHTHLGWIGKEK